MPTLVSVRLANMLLAGSWGPHGNSRVGVSNHLESRRLPVTQPLSKRLLNKHTPLEDIAKEAGVLKDWEEIRYSESGA
jgi:hypothetical protein